MVERDWLAERFEENRPHLTAVAERMLGSPSEADDAVQEAWLRFSRADTSGVDNVSGWLTTVVARVCLDMLRSRKSRAEKPMDENVPEPIVGPEDGSDPEYEALLADLLGPALLVVLDTLAPAERVAFVLHDIFAVPFEEIAPIVDRSPIAARHLASRARRRVRGAATSSDADLDDRRKIVEAFLAAARGGDFAGLLAVLDPDVVFRADAIAARAGAPSEVRGATVVAKLYSGRAHGARPALVNGAVGMIVLNQRRRLFLAFVIGFRHGKIVEINVIADPERRRQFDVVDLRER